MQKQITEIARVLCDAHEPCKKCVWSRCNFGNMATRLYNAGYRKESDTAKEIFAEIGKILTAKYNSIQADCHHRMRYGNVDTPQGMEELGELSGVRQVIAEIKAFEKKYLEENDAESN